MGVTEDLAAGLRSVLAEKRQLEKDRDALLIAACKVLCAVQWDAYGGNPSVELSKLLPTLVELKKAVDPFQKETPLG